jgi:hypothetical protein
MDTQRRVRIGQRAEALAAEIATVPVGDASSCGLLPLYAQLQDLLLRIADEWDADEREVEEDIG